MSIKKFFVLNKRGILSLLLLFVFILSLSQLQWNSNLIHAGGKSTLTEIIKSLFNPNLSSEILKIGLISSLQTLVYAVTGIGLALVIAIFFGVLSSGVLFRSVVIKTVSRGLLGFMRAIHELIWAWLFVAAIGLSPLAAIFALGIPYGGTLGRVFSDLLQDVPPAPIEALKTSGATPLQQLFYGYFPSAFSNMLSYTMYRLECAIRSSSILSFVGLGGLGFQIQISLQDLRYNEVWTFLFFLVALVMIVDWWSNLIRSNKKIFGKKFNKNKFSLYLLVILMICSWSYVFIIDKANIFEIFTQKNLTYTKKFVQGLLGIGEELPAFLNKSLWKNALLMSLETLIMSLMAIGFATIGMLLSVIPASRNIANGNLTLRKKWYGYPLFYIHRALYIFSRSVPELLWAMIVVFIFKPGILPGAIALGIHNYGILGKLCSEVVEDMETKPIMNLASCGASQPQLFLYGIIPTVMNKFLTYILYRWEVIIRTSIIVGFVGAGGLGQDFKLAMSFFKYSEMTLYLICYILLVYLTDIVSNISRKIIE